MTVVDEGNVLDYSLPCLLFTAAALTRESFYCIVIYTGAQAPEPSVNRKNKSEQTRERKNQAVLDSRNEQ
ncbi:hypothetical protein JMG10_01485 [Nostoc ellipsosporum NOK]|nr:hypothetical protein [Nostoc ellipsosporum NOK]